MSTGRTQALTLPGLLPAPHGPALEDTETPHLDSPQKMFVFHSDCRLFVCGVPGTLPFLWSKVQLVGGIVLHAVYA